MDSSEAASAAGGANRFGAEGTGGDGGAACSKTSYSPPYTPSVRAPPPCRRMHILNAPGRRRPTHSAPARSGHAPLAQESGQEALARLAALRPRPPLPAPPAQHLHRLPRGRRHGHLEDQQVYGIGHPSTLRRRCSGCCGSGKSRRTTGEGGGKGRRGARERDGEFFSAAPPRPLLTPSASRGLTLALSARRHRATGKRNRSRTSARLSPRWTPPRPPARSAAPTGLVQRGPVATAARRAARCPTRRPTRPRRALLLPAGECTFSLRLADGARLTLRPACPLPAARSEKKATATGAEHIGERACGRSSRCC